MFCDGKTSRGWQMQDGCHSFCSSFQIMLAELIIVFVAWGWNLMVLGKPFQPKPFCESMICYFDKNLAKVSTTNVLAKSCDGNMFITVAIIVMTPLYSLPDCCTPTQIPTITLDLWSYFLFFLEAFQAVHCMIKSSSERLLHIFYWSL